MEDRLASLRWSLVPKMFWEVGTASGTPCWLSLLGARPLCLPTQADTVSVCCVWLSLYLPCSLQAAVSAAQAGLLRQQEELDRKAAELERKERELQNTVANLHGKGGCWGLGLPCLA